MKIALIGPGYGHNIIPYLMFLYNQNEHQVDFYFHNKDAFSKEYKDINFLAIPKKLLQLFRNARKYDVVWLMGGGRLLYVIALLKFFMRPNSKLVIFPYGEELPRKSTENNFKGFITTKALLKFTYIHCGWYGIADLLNPKLKSKILLHVMGLNEDFYKVSSKPDKEIVKLMNIIDSDNYNFYYPKSFLSLSRHDLVIKAVKLLKLDNSIPSFRVYFIGGNVIDNKRYNYLLSLISKYHLEDDIIILPKNKFFKTEDLNLIWSKVDCGLQIAQLDGLSTTIFEPLINKKELSITNIPPYRYLQSYFGVNFELTSLTAEAIAEEMRKKILGINTKSEEEKSKIKEVIQEKYSFEKNIEKLLLRFEKGN